MSGSRTLPAVELGPIVAGSGIWENRGSIPAAHPIEISLSHGHGRLELITPLPPESLRRTLPWLVQKEPEEHLVKTSDLLLKLLDRPSFIFGATFKDASLLDAIESSRSHHTVVREAIASGTDISIIQEEFAGLGLPGGPVNGPAVLIARHLTEHVFDLEAHFRAIQNLIGDEGFVVLEVPDTLPALLMNDFSEIWDEHIHYFTKSSLRWELVRFGFDVLYVESLRSDGENILLAVAKVGKLTEVFEGPCGNEVAICDRFLLRLSDTISQMRSMDLSMLSGLVLYGANHRACNFIDIFLPPETPVWVVDDDERKQGLYVTSRGLRVQDPMNPNLPKNAPVVFAFNQNRVASMVRRTTQLVGPKIELSKFSSLFEQLRMRDI